MKKSNLVYAKIVGILLVCQHAWSFTFKLSGNENMRCFRFRNPQDKKPVRVVEFFYESQSKKKDLQVQLHDELFKNLETGDSSLYSLTLH